MDLLVRYCLCVGLLLACASCPTSHSGGSGTPSIGAEFTGTWSCIVYRPGSTWGVTLDIGDDGQICETWCEDCHAYEVGKDGVLRFEMEDSECGDDEGWCNYDWWGVALSQPDGDEILGEWTYTWDHEDPPDSGTYTVIIEGHRIEDE